MIKVNGEVFLYYLKYKEEKLIMQFSSIAKLARRHSPSNRQQMGTQPIMEDQQESLDDSSYYIDSFVTKENKQPPFDDQTPKSQGE